MGEIWRGSAMKSLFGGDATDGLSIFSSYIKLTKLAKIHKKARFLNLTRFRPLKLTTVINLKNLAPLYF
jgi:hypothetical protein